jgi:ribosomal protein S18 acetylase RimI-like enzyme
MTSNSIRIEPIDHRHPAWSDVLAAIFRSGQREALLLREDGWLSSRQTVLAAFDGSSVVGHLCFRLEPIRSLRGGAEVRSRIDSFSVDNSYAGQAVDQMLVRLAESQARLMKCTPPRVQLTAC